MTITNTCWLCVYAILTYTLPRNIDGYVQFLINTLDTLVRRGIVICRWLLGRGCLTWVPGTLGGASGGVGIPACCNPHWMDYVYCLVLETIHL